MLASGTASSSGTAPSSGTATTRTQVPAAGFTLMELLVTLTIMSMLFAIIIPNLGAFLPTARLEGSGKQIKSKIDWARSEARIRGLPMALELDLDRARWRVVFPPDMRLTIDDDERALEEWSMGWRQLETGVVFAGAGDARNGIARRGAYRIRFDEYGFSNDQVMILKLEDEPDMLWSLQLRGLTGVTTVESSENGLEPELQLVGEGAF